MLKLKLQYLGHRKDFFTDVKNWLIGKYPDAGKGWGQEGKEAAEDEVVK